MLAAFPSRANSAFGSIQLSCGACRRPAAAPLRLYAPLRPFSGVTRQTSAATHTQDEQNAMEEAMRLSKLGNGTTNGTATKKPAELLAHEAEALKAQFMRVQEEVKKYKCLSEHNAKMEDELGRLKQEKQDLETTLAEQREQLQHVIDMARDEATAPLKQQLAELSSRVESQQEELRHAVDVARAEAEAPLQQQLEALTARVAAHQEELQRAVQAARAEAAGPMQQQLEELSMQLQNSQAQLERLGEAVETAEAEKAAAVQAAREENQQLLLTLEGVARRLTDVVYPPGSLPPGIIVSTRLEGNVDLQAFAEQQNAAAAAAAAAAATAAMALEAPAATTSSPTQPPAPQQLPEANSALQQQQREGRGPSGFLGWLFGMFRLGLYHAVGALLLYYAASIMNGRPPSLNDAFLVGSFVVCTLVSWTNNLLFPRAAA